MTGTTNNGIWSRPSVDGKVALRSAHSSVLLKNNIIAVFGGWDGNSVLDDLVFYQIELHSWVLPENTKGNKPLKRAGHTGTLLPNSESFLLFGGSDGERYLSDTHIYDYQKNEWKEVITTGIKPPARSRHSATLIPGENKIYFFGGSDLHNTFNSLYVLDIDSMKWSIPNCKGDNPPLSWGHTSTYYNNCLYFFGGNDGNSKLNQLSILDLSTHTWRVNVSVESVGPAPSARLGHSFLTYKNIFILLGGGSADKILNDCFIFYPETMTWKHFSGENPPPQRCAHSSACLPNDGLVYIYGGTDGTRYFKDIYILDIEKVLAKLENAPKKRIRLRPLKKSNEQQLINNNIILNNSNNNLTTTSTTTTTTTTTTNTNNNSNGNNGNIKSSNNNILNSSSSTTPSLSPSTNSSPTISTTSFNNNNSNHSHHNGKSNNTNNYNNQNIDTQNKFKGIIEWLTKHGLEKYQDNFILNDITLENLDCLTERHLIEDLCIPTLGARLKILNNILLQRPKEKKEKDEKEILQESINSLKAITENLSLTLSSLTLTIQNLALNNNNINNKNSHDHSNHSTPPLPGFNQTNGRRNSHY
ncbi:hypothetical protein DICPUDRAFT_154101 [Dictyostelium purpureum]|uniref:SAM domain-containing protein n=1 Tax=Dictyostelium purpureum TaxID=5786 RepID=F0ZQK7_DICPU|nr:uncharacterized protein DICPUDRAFT_154101 [Dictyostelium purpureum]EGC33783.1 hypothetical protein DICPUDRAFT_154101 [Dictyostelium purpureum]|eukprot:XP_003289708.1 hypothetical protein DICPUDRAFT_154101 [Dictyostelium purpureum]